MRARLLSCLLAACSFEHGQPPNAAAIDASLDPVDGPPSCVSFSSQVDTCKLAPSTADLTLTGTNTYDTATGTLTAGSAPVPVTRIAVDGKAGAIDVIVVRDFRMTANARLRATGPIPLAILAFGTITLEGSAAIDVSGGGAGARTSCPGGAIDGIPKTGGAGGGGGGAFAAPGGSGGNGDSDGAAPAPGGPGGAAFTSPSSHSAPAGPLGGCPGARGGNGDDPGGAGGAGGGAIYLVAATRIDLAAGSSINAGGAGGQGGDAAFLSDGDAGGGGGGSGGMILFESPIVRSAGTLAANGGGGGEASGNGGDGANGEGGGIGTNPAPGGNGGSSSGTDGAVGGAQASPQGASVMALDKGGGGGGGGSVGFIVVESADAIVSLASPNPS